MSRRCNGLLNLLLAFACCPLNVESICGLGWYQNRTTFACQKCPVGSFRGVDDNRPCELCEVGKYTDMIASSACKSCPPGFDSPLGSVYGWSCLPSLVDSTDGQRQGEEICDDGNAVSGDGCSSLNTIEAGFICTYSDLSSRDVCRTVCGDSFIAGDETCDDGNAISGDGCSSACKVEPGFICGLQLHLGSPAYNSSVCALQCNVYQSVATYPCKGINEQPPANTPVWCFPEICPPASNAPTEFVGELGCTLSVGRNLTCIEITVVASAVWGVHGTSIEVKTNHQVVWQHDLCSDIFDDSASFGEGALCLQRDSQTLTIELGRDFTLSAQQQILKLRSNVAHIDTDEIQREYKKNCASCRWQSVWSAAVPAQSITIQSPPTGFDKITARITSSGQATLGAELILEGTNSQGGGGTVARRYSWSATGIAFDPAWNGGLQPYEVNLLRSALLNAYDKSLQGTRNQSVAVAKISTTNLYDASLNATGQILQAWPTIDVTFRLDVASLFSNAMDSAIWTMTLIPGAPVPQIIPRSPLIQISPVGSDVDLWLEFIIPWNTDSNLIISWEVLFQDGSTQSANNYVQPDPGFLRIPKRSMPVGTCVFTANVSYQILGSTTHDIFSFQVTYVPDVPVAVVEGPSIADVRRCTVFVSAAASFDASLVYPNSEQLVLPLPEANYRFDWKCEVAKTGSLPEIISDSLLQSWVATPEYSCPPNSFLANHAHLTIHKQSNSPNRLLSIHVRVVRLGALNVSSNWASLVIRVLAGSNATSGRPQIDFLGMPSSPLQHGATVDTWAIVDTGCGPTGTLTPSVLNLGTGATVGDLPDPNNATHPAALQIVQSYGSFSTMPDAAQQMIFTGPNGAHVYANPALRFHLLRINTGVMQPGGRYRLSLHMQYHQASASSQDFYANMEPIGGTLLVSPLVGNAAVTMFHVFAMDWHDADLPLNFAFWRRASKGTTGKEFGLDPNANLLSDWSQATSISTPLPGGQMQILSRVRDGMGMESNVTVISDTVNVQHVTSTDSQIEAYLREMVDSSTHSPQLFGAIDTLVATIAWQYQQGYRISVPDSLVDAAIRCLRKAQYTRHEGGSKAGALQQASLLNAITSMVDDTLIDASTRSVAIAALSHSLQVWQASSHALDQVGMARDDAEQYVQSASNLVALVRFEHQSSAYLLSHTDATLLDNAMETVGGELGKRAAANKIGSPSSVQAHNITVGAFVFTTANSVTSTTPLPLNPSIADLAKAHDAVEDENIEVQVSHVGDFVMPLNVLRSALTSGQEMGIQTNTTTSIISAHRWHGNPFSAHPSDSFTAAGQVLAAKLFNTNGETVGVAGLTEPILLRVPMAKQTKMQFRQQLLSGVAPQCKFWNPAQLSWDGDGCRVLDVRKAGTEMLCACTHLTSFGNFLQGFDLFQPSLAAGPDTDSAEELAKEDIAWPYVAICFSFVLLWLLTAWCRDLGRYNLIHEEIVWRMHFRDDPLATKKFKFVPEKVDIADEEDPEEYLAKIVKPFETGTDRIVWFLEIFRVMRQRQYFGFSDLKKKGVQRDICAAFSSELAEVVGDHLAFLKEERGEVSAQSAFRDKRLLRRVKDRLEEITHLAILSKRHRCPDLPWSCAGFMSLSCHGVHPWENRKPVRQVLGIDALVPVHLQLDAEGIQVFSVPKTIKLPWQGIPPAGWFKEHADTPFMTASWAVIKEHQAVKEKDVAKMWDSGATLKFNRFEERLERIAMGGEEGRASDDQPGRIDEIDARVLEICDEFDRHVAVHQRFRNDSAMSLSPRHQSPPTSGGDETLAPTLRAFLEDPSNEKTIAGSGLEEHVRGWENKLLWKATPQESSLAEAFGKVGTEFEFWDLLEDQGADVVKPGFRKNAMRILFSTLDKPPDEVFDRWHFKWDQLDNVKKAAGLSEEAVKRYTSQYDPHVEFVLYGLGPKALVDFRETVLEFRGRCSQNVASAARDNKKESVAPRRKRWGQPERDRKENEANAQKARAHDDEHVPRIEPNASTARIMTEQAQDADQALPEVATENVDLDALEAKWAQAINGYVQPAPVDGPLDITGIEPMAPGQRAEWPARIAVPPFSKKGMTEKQVQALEFHPCVIVVSKLHSPLAGSSESSPTMFRVHHPYGSPMLHLPLEGFAVPVESIVVHRISRGDFPLPPAGTFGNQQLNNVRALTNASALMLTNESQIVDASPDTHGRGVIGDQNSRLDPWEERLAGIASVQAVSNERSIVPVIDSSGPEDLHEILVAGGGAPTFRIFVKTQASENRSFAVDIHSIIQAQLLEDRFRAPEFKALAGAAAPPKPKEEAKAEPAAEIPTSASNRRTLGFKKKQVKSKSQLAQERRDAHIEETKTRHGLVLQAQMEKREQTLKNAFTDPLEETAEEFVEFNIRRFSYLFYDPCTLFCAIILKTHPCTRVYLFGWIGLIGVQRTLTASVYIMISFALSALSFHCGIMDLAEEELGNLFSTSANTTNISEAVLAWTTTTTAAPSAVSYDSNLELLICAGVAAVSMFVAVWPSKVLKFIFKRHIYFARLTAEAKKKVMGSWKSNKTVGLIVGILSLLLCFGWIAYFVHENDRDRESDFLISAGIIIGWALFLWPGILCIRDFVIISIVRVTGRFDELIEILGVTNVFDFTMFTAGDASQQARQLAALRNVILTDEIRARARTMQMSDDDNKAERPHGAAYLFARRLLYLCCVGLARKLRRLHQHYVVS